LVANGAQASGSSVETPDVEGETVSISEPIPFDAVTAASLMVDHLVACLVNGRIYQATHARVQGSLERLRSDLEEFAEATSTSTILIGVADHIVFCQGRPLVGATIGSPRLVEVLGGWQAGGIEFLTPLTLEELQEVLLALIAKPPTGATAETFQAARPVQQGSRIRLLARYVEDGPQPGLGGAIGPNVRVGLRFYQGVIDLLQNATVAVCRGGRIDFAPVQAQAESMLRQLEAQDQTTLGLLRQEQYDAFTFGHSLRVALLAMQFARALTDDRELLVRIGTAGLLHDVGKAQIPFELLHSTRQLTEEERRIMNRHAELGAEILLDHKDHDPLAVAAAFGHHRGPDGSGYPRTQHDHELTMVTSIVKICDIYEALTAARPYKQPMSPIRAYRVMLAMGDKLDRALVHKFIESNGIYPVGQLVELNDGRLAQVRRQNKDPLRPTVALVNDVSHLELDTGDETLLDLADLQCCSAHSILCDLTVETARQRQASALDGPR
jgi:putative nucleotidyltransferase with HDIG domain